MTITTAHNRRSSRAGFSLPEIMVTSLIVFMVFAALFSSWGFIARSSMGIANYTDMNSGGRRGLDIFARDVRMARDISDLAPIGQSKGTAMTLNMGDGNVVRYEYRPQQRSFIRILNGEEQVLFREVDNLVLSRYNLLRSPALTDMETKQIQLELLMVKSVLSRDTSKKIVSARYIMRNKKVSE
jgi:hypothetical protein